MPDMPSHSVPVLAAYGVGSQCASSARIASGATKECVKMGKVMRELTGAPPKTENWSVRPTPLHSALIQGRGWGGGGAAVRTSASHARVSYGKLEEYYTSFDRISYRCCLCRPCVRMVTSIRRHSGEIQ